MKLYYSPGACSLAPHIVAEELGVKLEVVKVDLKKHETEKGEDYYKIAPKGSVPALMTDAGDLLTEGPAISQYLCSLKMGQTLLPEASDFRRFRVLEWLNFTTSEIHKTFSVLFTAPREYSDEAVKKQVIESAKKRLHSKFEVIEKSLAKEGPYLTGSQFSPADAYLYTVLGWAKPMGVDLSRFSKILGFLETCGARPAVQRARAAEGTAQK